MTRSAWTIRTLNGAHMPAALALLLALAALAFALAAPQSAHAAVLCPNSNPVVNENNCMGPGTTSNQLSNYSEELGAFTTKSSYNRGEDVQLKIGTSAPSFPATSVSVAVYRIGYYGGAGARLIPAASSSSVAVNNTFKCNPMNASTGELSCSNWQVSYTIPGSSLPVSGIYEAVMTDLADGGIQNLVVFAVREDSRASNVLFVLPDATYQAYNNWGCKSLYFDRCGGANTIAGDGRAVAVSFERPEELALSERNRFFGPDYKMVFWLEEQGYDVTYTDDIQTDANPAAPLIHKAIVISGHSEYWSAASFNNMLAARNAGVSIASFSSNTAYWQTRYENNYRTLVCYKTIQGSDNGNAGATPNDPAATGPHGEILPQFATTSRRDPGAPAGSPTAPPGGRIGPNEPENQLWGNMYVGDNESQTWGLTVPAGNSNGEFASSGVWRHTGISQAEASVIGEKLVGWEWDQIPTQASYLAFEPPGVKRVTLTEVGSSTDSWLQDAGRERADTPPAGEASNVSAVEYRTPSGATVFAAGTNYWANGLEGTHAISQATYNILSEMGAQPGTPEQGLTLDPSNAVPPPYAAFTATPAKVLVGQTVTLDASGSTDASGTITDYRWDLDGSGAFATDTGTNPRLMHAFSAAGTYTVGLQVTDSNGQTETSTRIVRVESAITARVTAVPNPVGVGQTVTLNAAASADVSGSISDYAWDLEGSGKYAVDSGTSPIETTSFQSTGPHTINVRVSDGSGNTSTATITINVVPFGVSSYPSAVLGTPGLLHFYRLSETAGPTVADSAGNATGTLTGATFGVPGAVNGDPSTAVSFDGAGDTSEGNRGSFGAIPLNLTGQKAVTVEFWLKWSQYFNDDALAMEFTPNYNTNAGGFIVDPDAPQFGGTFAVGIGEGTARTDVYFKRPSAGVWHHYALVLDPTQPSAQQITPYVDGSPVSFQQAHLGTGAMFANSTLYLMSRGGNSLFGSGSLADLALYSGDLPASRIQEHFWDNGTAARAVAALTIPSTVPRVGQSVVLNASGSSYSNGQIVDYRWDLDGSGTYSTNTGTSPTLTTSFPAPGTYNIGVGVTDSDGGWDYTTKQLTVANLPPTASITASPTPVAVNQNVTFNGSGSTDQGSIVDFRWDLDGSGNYATDTGTTPTVKTSFASSGTHTVGLQVTDDLGMTSRATVTVTAEPLGTGVSSYPEAVLGTPGLIHYYRLGEAAGPTISDAAGSANGTVTGGKFGEVGAIKGDPDTALGFNGTSDFGAIPMNLSSTSHVTVEFWLKWNKYSSNEDIALEFTPNFNTNAGGFLVDPNAAQYGGTFGVGLGKTSSMRNTVFFTRPSAGVWHYYAFVLDTTQPGATQITPYVDGQSVSYQKANTGTSAGAFANSTLYLMSRAGTTLFGTGTLDELAIYNTDLNASTIATHYGSYGTNKPPTATFTATPNPALTGQSVTLNASGSGSPSEPIIDYQWDLKGTGNYETETGSSPSLTTTFTTRGTHTVGLRVIDANNVSGSTTQTITVNQTPATAVTGEASTPTQTASTLNATVNPNYGAVSECRFEYGTTTSYGSSAPCSSLPGAGSSPVAVSASLSGLSANTTYHYRIVATNAAGTSYGLDATLATPPNPPIASSGAAGLVRANTATLNATVDPSGGNVTECFFEYGTTTGYGFFVSCTSLPGSGTSPVAVSAPISGLTSGTSYHYRIVAANRGGSGYGTDQLMSTMPVPPEVDTEAASSVARTSATLNATVNPEGLNVSECRFEYGTTTSYGSSAPCSSLPGSGRSPVSVSGSAAALTVNTTYHYRIVATDDAGTTYGADRQFTTLAPSPTVTAEPASGLKQTSATLNASVNPEGQNVSECSFEYGTTTAYGSSAPCSSSPGSGRSAVGVSAPISGLSANTTYHYRISATNGAGTSYSGDQQLTTLPNAPATSTGEAGSIQQVLATLNATVNPEGANVGDCHFEYGPTNSYGNSIPCATLPGSGSGPVAVSATITVLAANTTYHYRIVATNAGGTNYGGDRQLTTLPNPPAVVTESASNVLPFSAELNATVNPEGAAVSDCHFEYGTTTSYGSSAACSSLPGSGTSPVSASASISSLSVNTRYHYRIVSTNPGGTSYGSDQQFSTSPNPPAVVTGEATLVKQTTATLGATVDPEGQTVSDCHFEYGTTTGYGTSIPCATLPGSGTTAVTVTATPTGLSANTTYHYRISATNPTGTSHGSDQQFSTSPNPPAVVTGEATLVKQTTATLGATVDPEGQTVSDCHFEYGTTTGYGTSIPCATLPGSGTTAVTVTATPTGLSANTTYHYRIVSTNPGGTSYGSDQQFSTSPNPPAVVTGEATLVKQTTATLGATVDPEGQTVSDCHFEYGTTTGYGTSIPCATLPGSGTTAVTVTSTPTGLSANTTYHYRIVSTNPGGTSYGSDQQFSTSPNPPAVVTGEATLVKQTTATLGATVDPEGQTVSDCHFEYGTTTGYGTSIPCATLPGSGTTAVTVTSTPTGLSANTTYHYRIVSTNPGGTSYGSDQQFSTSPNPPAVVTGEATLVKQTTATLGATVDPEGQTVSDCHFEYGTTTGYGTSIPCATLPGSGTTAVTVTATPTGLSANTTYHYRISATNPTGTSHGSDQQFTTTSNAPTVTTGEATLVKQTSATLNATVNPEGQSVTECRFEYGTSNSYGSSVPCASLPGSGTSPVAVSASITGLNANTTYHYRVTAANAGGPAHGADQSLVTNPTYYSAVLGTTGLLHYYRLGEAAGPTVTDSFGSSNGTITGGKFGEPGAISGDPNTALAFNGTSDFGAIPMNLSSTSHVTVEFWLKWNKYSSNEDIALEFTPNFNTNAGGFLVDPNAAQYGGTFGVGLGKTSSMRNTVFFTRPSAGVWHYYAFVLDTTQPGATQITPYVDGQSVSYQKANTGTSAGAFANSTLYLMSRAGTTLFGTGTLDELAIYNTDLNASTIATHYGDATP